jgi:hypothetical protein
VVPEDKQNIYITRRHNGCIECIIPDGTKQEVAPYAMQTDLEDVEEITNPIIENEVGEEPMEEQKDDNKKQILIIKLVY